MDDKFTKGPLKHCSGFHNFKEFVSGRRNRSMSPDSHYNEVIFLYLITPLKASFP